MQDNIDQPQKKVKGLTHITTQRNLESSTTHVVLFHFYGQKRGKPLESGGGWGREKRKEFSVWDDENILKPDGDGCMAE